MLVLNDQWQDVIISKYFSNLLVVLHRTQIKNFTNYALILWFSQCLNYLWSSYLRKVHLEYEEFHWTFIEHSKFSEITNLTYTKTCFWQRSIYVGADVQMLRMDMTSSVGWIVGCSVSIAVNIILIIKIAVMCR